MRSIKNIYLPILVVLFLIGCSKLKDTLPSQPASPKNVHGIGWIDTSSVNFHGKIVLSDTSRGFAYCRRCHGDSLQSTGLAQVSCAKSGCHTAHFHLAGWTDPKATNFHGTVIRNNNGDYSACQKCHGTDLKGGSVNKSCFDAGCHAAGFHGAGFGDPASSNFHKFTIRTNKYSLTNCKGCHGPDYNGGLLSNNKSCNNTGCHTAADKGPEACYTCHGSWTTKDANPPKSLHDEVVTTARGVGAHVTHLKSPVFTTMTLKCQICHTLPSTFNSPGHIDINDPNFPRATVVMTDTLAFTKTIGTVGTPSYDPATIKCSNVYCHGNFTNGNHSTPQFNGTDQAKCGTCHGDPVTGNPLPKAPHLQVTVCGSCHTDTMNPDNVTFKDKSKHMDGKLEVYGSVKTDW